MKFSFNQLKKFWQEKDQVTWQQVKSYLEKHLEVEVEEEVPIDIPDSWWLKEVAPANEKNSRAEVHLENGSVIPVYLPEEVSHGSSSSGTSICVLVDTKTGTLLSRGDLGPLQELLGFATVSSNGSEAGSSKEAGTSAGRDDLSDVVLLRNAPEGPLKEVLELPDMLIKLSVLPNRGDLSHLFGLAREIACGMGLTLVVPTFQHKLEKRNGLVSIQTDGCLVYVGMLLENLKVEESPWWLKLELMRFGQRCINNVVDLTNYFLFNYGQPMHAFDFDTLTDHRIVVRQAKSGEKLVLLNNEEVTLDEDCMVIADAVKPVGVAGVMGGRDASVSSQTKRVLLEVAAFAPSSVAMSSRKLGVRTDASMLYERGVAPFGQVDMALLFADFVEQMGCAQATALWFAGEERRYRLVDYNPQRIVKLSSVKDQDLVDMISTKQWEVITEEGNNDGKKKIRIPAYRWDITRTEDLVDELVKFVGYDRIPSLPLMDYIPFREKESITKENKLREASSLYFQEVFMVSLISDKDVQNISAHMGIDAKNVLAVDNPVSRELAYLRPNLLISLIKAALLNQNRFHDDVHLFEIGSVFTRVSKDANSTEVEERRHIAYLSKGLYWENALDKDLWSYREFKGALENIFERCNLALEWENALVPWAESQFSGIIKYEGREVGQVGMLKPSLLKAYDLKGPVFAAELDLDVLPLVTGREPVFPLKFPQSWRDLSVVMPVEVPVSELAKLFEGEPLVKDWKVVDLYRGEKLSPGKKSVTVRVWLGAEDHTVSSEEVDQVVERVLGRLTEAGWHLRT